MRGVRQHYPLDCPLALFSKNLRQVTSPNPSSFTAAITCRSVAHCTHNIYSDSHTLTPSHTLHNKSNSIVGIHGDFYRQGV